MKRKFILILISLIIVGTAAFFYIDTVFLPIQFKSFVTSKAEKFLNRQVTIGTIDFKIFKGLVFEDVTVFQKDDADEPFMEAQKITFNLLLIPFFQKKTVIIPNVKIDEPFVYVGRNKKGKWNFSDLLDLTKTSKGKSVPPILLRKLYLEDGIVHFTDKTQKETFHESFENIYLNTTLSLNKGIRFIAQAHVPKLKSSVTIKGNHTIITKKLTAQVMVNNIHLPRYLSLFEQSRPLVDFDKGIMSAPDLNVTYQDRQLQIVGSFDVLDTNMLIGKNNQIAGGLHVSDMLLTRSDQKWDIKGKIQLPDVQITSKSGKEFQGDLTANLKSLAISKADIIGASDITINNAHLKIDDNKYLKGNITATDISLSKINDAIELAGSVDIAQSLIFINDQMTVKGNLSTQAAQLKWSSLDNKGNRELEVGGDLRMDSALLTLKENQLMSGIISAPKANLVYDLKKVTIEIQGQINEANVSAGATQKFQGNPHFNIFVEHDLGDSSPVDYKGTLHLTKGQLNGIPTIEKVNDIEGTITILPNQANTNELTFNTQDTNIQLSGSLTNFKKPKLDIEASSENIELEKIFTLFPNLAKKIKGSIVGKSVVQASYQGSLRSPSDANIESTVQVTEAAVMLDSLDDDITNVSGQLEYKTDLLIWDNLLANYKNRSYTLNGQLANFSRPTVDTTVLAEQLSFTTQIKILRQAFKLTEFVGSYLNSNFDLKGDVHFFKDAEPDLDLRGKVTLDLEDIGTLIPRLENVVHPFDFSGIVVIDGLYRGKLADWRDWQLAFTAESNKIMVKNYPFENVTFQFAQRDNAINKHDISSTIYNGALNITSSADLRDSDVPFTTTMTLENLDLKEFRKDQELKNQELAGIVNVSSSLQGDRRSWEKLTGEGSFTVTEGHLWQWNILKGISGALLIPEFKTMAFTEAHGNFAIHNQKITTQNTTVVGNTATLLGKGWIDFERNINFDIEPTFSKIAILQSDSLKKSPTSIFTQTEGYINIELTGTLDDPHYNVKKFPIKILEETLGDTTGALKEVLESIIDEVF